MSDTHSNELAVLTQGMQQGREDAFRQFHEVYFHRLLRYLLVITHGNEEAAREALQATFLRVVKHVRRFEDEKVFWSWLTVLARSAARDRGRKIQRYWKLLQRYALFQNKDASNNLDDTDETTTEEQLYRQVEKSLNHLSPLDRSLIESKYLRGSTVAELAQGHALSPKAVESRLLRARRQLRALLLKELNHEAG